MTWKLPPLNALRVFEVTARHSSFTRAADELCVTPGAVSRQIRGLEDFLGKPLFDRDYREVRLSDESRAYADELFTAFARVDQATKRFVGQGAQEQLRVFAPITFALRWLMPRMASWHARFPNQVIKLVNAGMPPVDLDAEGIDVAIRLAGPSHNLKGERMFDIDLTPVCSPSYRDAHNIGTIADLEGTTLLHSSQRLQDWQHWFESFRVEPPESREILTFESSSMAYETAASGFGLAIAMRPLVEDDLSSGRLVAPFDHVCSDGNAFHVVYQHTARMHPAISGFVDWVCEEAARGRRPSSTEAAA